MSLTSTGGAGFNSSAATSGYTPSTRPQLRTIQNESSGFGNVMGNAGIGGGPIRPPLYVPTNRETGRTS